MTAYSFSVPFWPQMHRNEGHVYFKKFTTLLEKGILLNQKLVDIPERMKAETISLTKDTIDWTYTAFKKWWWFNLGEI